MTKHTIVLWGIVGVLIIVSILGFIFGRGQPISRVKTPPPVTAADWVKGDPAAKAVLIEYSDFECPACAAYYPLVRQMEEKFGPDLAFVYRHFPLPTHRNAELAALAAEAAGRQRQFWAMHDWLFEHQTDWAGKTKAEEIFAGAAGGLALDENLFVKDLTAKELKDKVAASYRESQAIKLTGTPTFFLNGQELPLPFSAIELEKIIAEKLNQ
ncbi:MAG: thioredoxin domain-containing protein [Patescibacteria group bacterium]